MNLSDKELDRLSREAANQHDPGDLVGPRSWDRLEFRLDKELGRLSPGPLRGIRGIRRIPFYYAPAILLLVGVSYYFVKHGKGNAAKTESSGGPPMTLVKPSSPDPNNPNPSTKTLENSQNSTSKPDKELSAEYPAPTPATGSNPIAGTTPSADAATASGNNASSNTGSNNGSGNGLNKGSNTGSNTDNASKPSDGLSAAHHPAVGSATAGTTAAPENHPGSTTAPGENPTTGSTANAAPGSIPASGKKATGLTASSHKAPPAPENNATEAGANGSTASHAATVASHGAGTSHRPNGISPTNELSGANSHAGANDHSGTNKLSGSHKPSSTNNPIETNKLPGANDLSGTNKPSSTNSPIETNDLSRANSHAGANDLTGANSTSHRPGHITPGAAGKNHGRNTPSGTHPGEDGQAAADPLAQTSNNPDNLKTTAQQPATITPREAVPSLIQAPRSLARSGGIDDASLRAFTAKGTPVATPIRLGKKKDGSLHIDRPLTIGLSVSPDFASVHSVAGDKPGRSFGLTLDYQVLDRLYISTGLLLTRKNYTSNPNNYHAPDDYYRPASQHKIDLIKGSFDMLEIPLNLRYDFRANSSTVFFVSGGVSSYLMTSEHSQYYFDFFGRQECQNFDPRLEPKSRNYLFSAVNLSMGVETGLSNSLSLLVAPYVKIPTRGMGMGQVQITSIGLNFSLRYSPVLSRKRK